MITPDDNTSEEEQPVPGLVRSFFGRYRHWLVPLGKLGSGQALSTMIGGLFGLAILRIDQKEFALYTLFASIQQTIANFSDMGVSGAVISVGAKYRHDQRLFGHLMQTIKSYRELLFIISFLIGIFLCWQIYQQHEIAVVKILLCLVLTACTAWITIHNQMINGVLYLHEKFNVLSYVNPVSASIKLVLLLLAFAAGLDGLIALLVINLFGESCVHMLYRRQHAMPPKPPADDKESGRAVRAHVFTYAKPMVASSILHYIQPMIILWVLNGAANLTAIAKYGAVGRLGQITNFVTYLCTTLIITRMAKLNDRTAAKRLLLKLTAAQIVVVGCVVIGALIFAGPLLQLLGRDYSNLYVELRYFLASWAFAHFSGFFFLALIGQGISRHQGVVNVIAIAAQILFVFMIGITSAEKAFIMNIFYGAMTLVGQLILVYLYILKPPAVIPDIAQTMEA